MDKRETVDIFRTRITDLIERTGLSRSRFAASAGLDRSTLSQLLSDTNVRLPRAETIARIATRHSVSIDWLLGLSQEDLVATDIVPQLVIEPDAAIPADERLERWQDEARGYKTRYVPATLPDQLKIDEVIAYETGKLGEQAAEAWEDIARMRMSQLEQPASEIEVCSPRQAVLDFASGCSMWRDLPQAVRKRQLEHMRDKLRADYPSYRWFLYDGRERFSVPYTVFGPKRAAVYVGDMYFVFNSTEHIRALTGHFDDLIRHAVVQPNEADTFIASLLEEMS